MMDAVKISKIKYDLKKILSSSQGSSQWYINIQIHSYLQDYVRSSDIQNRKWYWIKDSSITDVIVLQIWTSVDDTTTQPDLIMYMYPQDGNVRLVKSRFIDSDQSIVQKDYHYKAYDRAMRGI